MRQKVLFSLLVFSIGIFLGNEISDFSNPWSAIDKKIETVSLFSTINLAYSSFLNACTKVKNAQTAPGDQFLECRQMAINYVEDNILYVLRQKP